MRRIVLAAVVVLSAPFTATPLRSASPAFRPVAAGSPTIDDLIPLERAGSPVISPDGRQVAYTARETNREDDRYETEIWIVGGGAGFSPPGHRIRSPR